MRLRDWCIEERFYKGEGVRLCARKINVYADLCVYTNHGAGECRNAKREQTRVPICSYYRFDDGCVLTSDHWMTGNLNETNRTSARQSLHAPIVHLLYVPPRFIPLLRVGAGAFELSSTMVES